MRNHKKPFPYQLPLNESKKAQSLSVIRLEAARKRIRHYPAFREQIWDQIRFQSWKYWALHGVVLLGAMLLALALRNEQTGSTETLAICSVFLVFAGNIFLSHVAGLFSWHMAELEQTLYLNLKQMVCIRMLEAGIAGLIILALFLMITGSSNTSGAGTALIYMLAPFLWSDTMYLHMLVNLRNASSRFCSFALGLLCGALALFPVMWEPLYLPRYLILWQVLAITGLWAFIAELHNLLGKIENGEGICLN